MMNTENDNTLERLKRKAEKGRAILDKGNTRSQVSGSEFRALLEDINKAAAGAPRQNAICEALLLMYEAGAYTGARITKNTTNA